MSFLAPLFLLGATAVVLPIVFHLIRRSPRLQRTFSSLMFLDASTPRLTRRSRLEHIVLLLLRCAVICLLALAFARPFLKTSMPEAPSGRAASRTVVLLDSSASMKRDGLWQAARERAESLIARSAPVDQVAVFAFDNQLRPLVTFTEWNATPSGERVGLVRSRMNDVTPGWLGTALDTAVMEATELLAESETPSPDVLNQVVVVTDFQQGTRTTDLQSYEWPQGVTVRTEQVKPRKVGNASLQWLADGNREGELAVRLRINNAPDSPQDQFQVGWAQAGTKGFSGTPLEVYVPAGQSRVISLASSNAPPVNQSVLLTGDDEPFDNQTFIIPPVKAQLKVLYFGEDESKDSSGPLYFLLRAFPDTDSQEIEVVPVKSVDGWPADLAAESPLIIATDTLSEAALNGMGPWLEQGGTLLFAPKSAASAPALARLLGVDQLPMTEFVPPNYGMLGEIDFRHPLFAPFADERFSDFTGIHFWKYRRIDEVAIPKARVLARFDNEDPALVEQPLGRGHLIVLASGWFPSDSQLALSSKFVPLLFSLLELSGKAAPPVAQCLVGDPWPVEIAEDETATILGPDGKVVTREAATLSTQSSAQPGLYTVGSGSSPRRFVVNLDPMESRTAPMPVDELEQLGVPVPRATPDAVRTAERKVTLHNAELETRQKFWRWAIVATLVLLLVETWLAGRTFRRATLPEGVNA